MSQQHVLDQLSAYLDGLAADPAAVETHLRQCSRCATRYAELHRLSLVVQSFEGPQVSAGFRANVLAAIERQPKRAPWTRLVWAPLASMAVVVLVVAGFSQLKTDRTISTAPPGPAAVDSQSVITELERRAAEGEEVEIALVAWSGDPGGLYTVAPDDVLPVLADAGYLDGIRDNPVWEDDLDAMILSLENGEAHTFRWLVMGSYIGMEL